MTEDSDEGSYSDIRFVLLDSELNLLYFSGPKKDNYISSDMSRHIALQQRKKRDNRVWWL